jgi:hypothetical protein
VKFIPIKLGTKAAVAIVVSLWSANARSQSQDGAALAAKKLFSFPSFTYKQQYPSEWPGGWGGASDGDINQPVYFAYCMDTKGTICNQQAADHLCNIFGYHKATQFRSDCQSREECRLETAEFSLQRAQLWARSKSKRTAASARRSSHNNSACSQK